MFGDAVDLAVIQTGTLAQIKATYNALLDAAINAGADYTESDLKSKNLPCGQAVMKCVHADWRWATELTSLSGGTPYAQ